MGQVNSSTATRRCFTNDVVDKFHLSVSMTGDDEYLSEEFHWLNNRTATAYSIFAHSRTLTQTNWVNMRGYNLSIHILCKCTLTKKMCIFVTQKVLRPFGLVRK